MTLANTTVGVILLCCVAAASAQGRCSRYLTPADCGAQRCHWANNTCGKHCAGLTPSTCTNVSYCRLDTSQGQPSCMFRCGSLPTASACDAVWQFEECYWNGAACNHAPYCGSVQSAAGCSQRQWCEWQTTVGVGQCTLRCSTIQTQSRCASHSTCAWNGTACGRSCRTYQAYDCEPQANSTCALSWDKSACVAKCSRYDSSETACASLGCMFNASARRCLQPCSAFPIAGCPTDRCTVAPEIGCTDRCDSAVTAASCSTLPACTWLGDSCRATCWMSNCHLSHCALYNYGSTCATRCDSFTTNATCTTSSSCVWSAAMNTCVRCRTLEDSREGFNCGAFDVCEPAGQFGAYCKVSCHAATTAEQCATLSSTHNALCNWINGTCRKQCTAFTYSDCPTNPIGTQASAACFVNSNGKCKTNCSVIVTPGATDDVAERECYAVSDCTWSAGACVPSCDVQGVPGDCPSRCTLLQQQSGGNSWGCYPPCTPSTCDPRTPQANIVGCVGFAPGTCGIACARRFSSCNVPNDGNCVPTGSGTCMPNCSRAALHECGTTGSTFADCAVTTVAGTPACVAGCGTLSRQACGAQPHCAWSSPLQRCTPVCSTRSGPDCTTGHAAGICAPLDSRCVRVCATIGDVADCSYFSHCEWLSTAQVCAPRCAAAASSADCDTALTNTSCRWTGSTCATRCAGQPPAVCASLAACAADTFPGVNGSAPVQTCATNCSALNASTCATDAHCVVETPQNTCVLACAARPSQPLCAQRAACMWAAFGSPAATNGTCQPACGTLTENACMAVDARRFCRWMHSSMRCTEQCQYIATAETCSATAGCAWGGVACGPDCSAGYHSEGACAAAGCQWAALAGACHASCEDRGPAACTNDGACVVTVTSPNATPSCVPACTNCGANDPGYCIQNKAGVCGVACQFRPTVDCADDFGCESILNPAVSAKPLCEQICGSVNTSVMCSQLAQRCFWAPPGVCLPQCQSSSFNADPPDTKCAQFPSECTLLNVTRPNQPSWNGATCSARCELAPTAELCTSDLTLSAYSVRFHQGSSTVYGTHCAWRGGGCRPVCAYHGTPGRCAAAGVACVWTAEGMCQSVCTDLATVSECTSASFGSGCVWTAAGSCKRSCGSYNVTTCPSIECFAGTSRCLPKCARLTTQTACEQNYGGLQWTDEAACFWTGSACMQNCPLLSSVGCPTSECTATGSACVQQCTTATVATCSTRPYVGSCALTQNGTRCVTRCERYPATACPAPCDGRFGVCSRPCSDFNVWECNVQGSLKCAWTGSKCAALCQDSNNATACAARADECMWGGNNARCAFRCDLARTKLACNRWIQFNQVCAWRDDLGACTPQCFRFSADACPSDACYPQPGYNGPTSGTCMYRCSTLSASRATCLDSYPSWTNCQWLNETKTCATQCSSISVYNNLTRQRCLDAPTCTAAAPTNDNVPCRRDCSGMTNATSCGRFAEDCAWLGGAVGCTQRCAGSCNGVHCESSGWPAKCDWDCSSFSPAMCTSPYLNGYCTLTSNGGACQRSCASFSYGNCPSGRCAIRSADNTCTKFSCNRTWEYLEPSCRSYPTQCMWIYSGCLPACTLALDNATCRNMTACVWNKAIGCTMDCARFDNQSTACDNVYAPGRACEFSTGDKCRTQCSLYGTDQIACTLAGYCVFDTQTQLCGDVPATTTTTPAAPTPTPTGTSAPTPTPTSHRHHHGAAPHAATPAADHHVAIAVGCAVAVVVVAVAAGLLLRRRQRQQRSISQAYDTNLYVNFEDKTGGETRGMSSAAPPSASV